VRVREVLRGEHKTPWFIDCGFLQTHRPFPEPTPEEQPERCRPLPWIADTPANRRDMAMFLRAATAVDVKIGYVLQALRESGHLDDTIILLTTDHGVPFDEAKTYVNDRGLRVMMVWAGGPFQGGKVVDGIVSQLDVFPTLCDVLGIARPGWLEGESLLPLMTGEKQEIHDAVFGEVNFHGGYRPSRTVRTPRWRYIRNYYERREYCHDESAPVGGRVMPAEELYDVTADPLEQRNLAADLEHAAVRAELSRQLTEWMQRVGDPLLSGNIDPPPFYADKRDKSKAGREAFFGRMFPRPGRYYSD
jgi:arylsulfatase A-like enzyme